MKVYLSPKFGEERGQGGIKRVVEAQRRYLPDYGVEFVEDLDQADLANCHATEIVDHPVICLSTHGLYWDGFEWPSWAYKANARIIRGMISAASVTAPSQWVAQSLRRGSLVDPIVCMHGIAPDEWQPHSANGGYILWAKNRTDSICDPSPINRLAKMSPSSQFITTFGEPASNVEIIGPQILPDMYDLIGQAGVYLATVRETGGITVLEAMACGVPILGWNWGVNPEIVVHGETGYLAQVGDYDDLLAGLAYCQSYRRRLSAAARQHILESFTWETVVGRYFTAYQQAMKADVLCANRPMVSVVITAYNLAEYLPDSIESVINQNFENWELIIVDDHSPDSCGEIADQFAAQDSRIKVIHNSANRYLAEARNIGFRRSRGKYLLPLDADDQLGPHALEVLTEALERDSAVDIATGSMELIEPDGRRWVSSWPPAQPDYHEQIKHHNQVSYASMYRRWVWERTGGYRRRNKTAEDAEFWCRAMSFGAKAARVTHLPTLIYRNRPDSMSHSIPDPDWTAWFTWAKMPEIAPFATSGEPPDHKLAWPVLAVDNPEVSVIIPVGPGHTAYLQDALDSLVGQTFENWETVVVNDTGLPWFNDEGNLIEPHLAGYPFVRWLDSIKMPQGPASARNRGIEASHTPLFVLLDADDYLQPPALDLLVSAWHKFGGWLYCDWYDQAGQQKQAENWNYRQFLQKMPGPITGIYSKKQWREVGGFDETAPGWEDWDFQIKLFERGICGSRLAWPLFTYRYHTGSKREENFRDQSAILSWLKAKHPIFKEESTMARCGRCGGGGGKSEIKPASGSSQSQITGGGSELVEIEYTGAAIQTMRMKSKVVPGREYRYGGDPGSSERHFFAYAGDVGWITSMKDFRAVAGPSTQLQTPLKTLPTLKAETRELGLEDQPISVLDIRPEMVGILSREGYRTIGDVVNASDFELLSLRGLKSGRLEALRDATRRYIEQARK